MFSLLLASAAVLALACGDRGAGPSAAVGDAFPVLPLQAVGGEAGTFRVPAGKAAVINVWATWCGPCRDEMDSLDRLRHAWPSERLAVVGIAVDDDAHLLDEYLRAHPVAFPVKVDPGMRAVREILGVVAVPETIVVGKDGRVMARVRGSRDWSGPEARALVERAVGW